MNTRREIVLAICVLPAAPLIGFAQPQGKIWRVGFLAQRQLDLSDNDYVYSSFTQGMRELGYIVGRNLAIEWRSAEGKTERLPELAAELVRMKVDVLVTGGTPASLAAQKATATIPIVMTNVADPLGTGLVKSLARPGGNSTALTDMAVDVSPKLLELLREMVPRLSRVAVLVNPRNAAHAALLKNIRNAAQRISMRVQPVEVATAEEIAGGFAGIAREKAGALVVLREAFFQQQRNQIVELATKQRLPTIGAYGEYAEAGGLMSYGQDIRVNYRRAAAHVDKILKGTNAGDIPVEQPTRFELFVNLKTAKMLGISVPNSIMVQAAKVIE